MTIDDRPLEGGSDHREFQIGAIEAGGTKMVCAAGHSWREVRDGTKFVVPTSSPEEAMPIIMDWFKERNEESRVASIGVASFGPIDFSTNSIAISTPKKAWRGTSWGKAINESLPGTCMGFDTDVNATGLAEWHYGNAKGKQVAVYLAVGTGIGGALLIDGKPVHGLLHPEMGHMFVPRQSGDGFAGNCPTHGDCLEGLAGGLAIAAR